MRHSFAAVAHLAQPRALKDAAKRAYLNAGTTIFVLSAEAVERLRDAARRILVESDEFRRLLRDLR